MRRILSSLLVALLLAGVLPVTVLAATMAQNASASTNEDTAVAVTLSGARQDQRAADHAVHDDHPRPRHRRRTGTDHL